MQVAIVTETYPPEINGVAMTIGRLVSGLQSRGHSVHVVRPRQHAQDQAAYSPHYSETLVIGLPIPKYQGLKFGLFEVFKLTRLWREQRPDLVHVVTEGPLGWAAVHVAKKLNLPVTSSFHTNFHSYTQHYGIGFLRSLTAAYLRGLHNATAATFVPTQVLADELQIMGFANTSVLSRGVDTGLYTPSRRSSALRASWGMQADDLAVLYVGRLAAEKNVELVLAAYRAIVAKVPSAKMIFVGDGPLKQSLQQSMPQAIFCGSKTGVDLASHYASGDLFLFPSVTETYGNVTAEALASGLCVLAYDRAAAAELIRNGDNGLTVASGDAHAFTQAATELAMQPERLHALRAQAAASIMQRDWQHVYDMFIAKLNEVVQQHAQATPRALNAAAMQGAKS